MLPHLTAGLIQTQFGEIGKLIFDRLEIELYFKLTNQKGRSNYSPSRFGAQGKGEMHKGQNAVNIKIHERISQRYEQLKREDWLLETDLIEVFNDKVRELTQKL